MRGRRSPWRRRSSGDGWGHGGGRCLHCHGEVGASGARRDGEAGGAGGVLWWCCSIGDMLRAVECSQWWGGGVAAAVESEILVCDRCGEVLVRHALELLG
jgi:hypothetical protein